jgi:hypothetical protein
MRSKLMHGLVYLNVSGVGGQLQQSSDGTVGHLFEDQQKRIAGVGTAPHGKLEEGVMLQNLAKGIERLLPFLPRLWIDSCGIQRCRVIIGDEVRGAG